MIPGDFREGRGLRLSRLPEGEGAMAADALLNLGGELARFSDKSMERLNQCLPPSWSRGNPVDLLENADTGRYKAADRGMPG